MSFALQTGERSDNMPSTSRGLAVKRSLPLMPMPTPGKRRSAVQVLSQIEPQFELVKRGPFTFKKPKPVERIEDEFASQDDILTQNCPEIAVVEPPNIQEVEEDESTMNLESEIIVKEPTPKLTPSAVIGSENKENQIPGASRGDKLLYLVHAEQRLAEERMNLAKLATAVFRNEN